jgi:hypothetical protein
VESRKIRVDQELTVDPSVSEDGESFDCLLESWRLLHRHEKIVPIGISRDLQPDGARVPFLVVGWRWC